MAAPSHVTEQLPGCSQMFPGSYFRHSLPRSACQNLNASRGRRRPSPGGSTLRRRSQEHGGCPGPGGEGACSGAGCCAETQLGAAGRECPGAGLRLQPRRGLPRAAGSVRQHRLPGHQLRARHSASQRHGEARGGTSWAVGGAWLAQRGVASTGVPNPCQRGGVFWEGVASCGFDMLLRGGACLPPGWPITGGGRGHPPSGRGT